MPLAALKLPCLFRQGFSYRQFHLLLFTPLQADRLAGAFFMPVHGCESSK
jgi:hypothetical protein